MDRSRQNFKRGKNPNPRSSEDSTFIESNSEVIKNFQNYAVELEEKQDKYERIIKLSRDITIESKRLIFLLHTFKKGTPAGEKVLSEAYPRFVALAKSNFRSIRNELHQIDKHQYLRAYTFGVQEFVEAYSFYRFLKSDDLVPFHEIVEFIEGNSKMDADEENPKMEDPPEHTIITMVDYVLGLNDLTGELMRYCINRISEGQVETAFSVCRFLNHLHIGMLSVGFNNREYYRKMMTVRQSLMKVEAACYAVRVRGSEFPEHMLISVLDGNDNRNEDFDM